MQRWCMLREHSCPYCWSLKVVRAGYSAKVPSFHDQKRQRLRCNKCKRRHSVHVHTIFFGLRKNDPGLNAKIFQLSLQGLSNRAVGRILYLSEHCVRLRIERMAKQALSFHSNLLDRLKIMEPLCFDGLQNFAGSQYDVNNIQQALGRDSLFIYDFNFASLNRSGRMSDWQKRRLSEIERDHGRYNQKSIRKATCDLFKRLHKKWGLPSDFTLLSDEHFQYRRVVNRDLRHLRINHVTISSKACRNFQNILFPVNHADLMIRQQLGAFARETISFSKKPGAMCQKYALYMVYKNYMTPQFTKKHVRRPDAHTKSPAEHVGLFENILEFKDIFCNRSTETDSHRLNDDWKHFWRGEVPPAHTRDLRFEKRISAF
jgi:transposase-like protein